MSSAHPSPQPRRLVFTGKQQVKIEPFELEPLKENEVRVRTRFSLMSTGTENIVFNRLFDADTHWDRWVKYPFYPGYASVGVVEAVGAKVTSVQAGDMVGFRQGHRSHAIVAEDDCHKIPAGVPLEHAVWFPLGKITFHGAKAANYQIGDSVLIIGAGPIGQMSVRWARASAVASILVVDALASRLALAQAGGATAVISASIEKARDQILTANGGKLPRIVIDSTGNPVVFAAAQSLAADFGRIVVLGDTGTPGKQSLTSDMITRGLTIVGAHDTHNNAEWNDRTISQFFLSLAASGRFSLDGLNSHVFDPADCEGAYSIANRDRASTMGIIFDWSDKQEEKQ